MEHRQSWEAAWRVEDVNIQSCQVDKSPWFDLINTCADDGDEDDADDNDNDDNEEDDNDEEDDDSARSICVNLNWSGRIP